MTYCDTPRVLQAFQAAKPRRGRGIRRDPPAAVFEDHNEFLTSKFGNHEVLITVASLPLPTKPT
jgi:hypothetical protein